MTLSCSTDHGTIMALSGSTGHRHGFRWWQGLWILAHPPAVAHMTNMKMASGSSMNCGDLWRRPNSENETLSPACALFHFSIVPTSLAHICSSECYCKLQCFTHLWVFLFLFFAFFCPNSFTCKNTHCKKSLVWFKVSCF